MPKQQTYAKTNQPSALCVHMKKKKKDQSFSISYHFRVKNADIKTFLSTGEIIPMYGNRLKVKLNDVKTHTIDGCYCST
jgi:hypothetical protein